jgi:hypothetical protein
VGQYVQGSRGRVFYGSRWPRLEKIQGDVCVLYRDDGRHAALRFCDPGGLANQVHDCCFSDGDCGCEPLSSSDCVEPRTDHVYMVNKCGSTMDAMQRTDSDPLLSTHHPDLCDPLCFFEVHDGNGEFKIVPNIYARSNLRLSTSSTPADKLFNDELVQAPFSILTSKPAALDSSLASCGRSIHTNGVGMNLAIL